jgi:3-dehydroquinate dehydratase/shikimate dehydrogenase
MAGNKAAPLLEAKDLNAKLVFDLVYNPLETPLLRLARQQSIPIVTGVEMFVQQGARQFEIFTGKPAPEEEMLRVVLHALRQRAEAAAAEPEPKSASIKAVPKPSPAKAAAKATPAKAAPKAPPASAGGTKKKA